MTIRSVLTIVILLIHLSVVDTGHLPLLGSPLGSWNCHLEWFPAALVSVGSVGGMPTQISSVNV